MSYRRISIVLIPINSVCSIRISNQCRVVVQFTNFNNRRRYALRAASIRHTAFLGKPKRFLSASVRLSMKRLWWDDTSLTTNHIPKPQTSYANCFIYHIFFSLSYFNWAIWCIFVFDWGEFISCIHCFVQWCPLIESLVHDYLFLWYSFFFLISF